MRLYGALSELASLVIRLASGKTVKIQANEQTAAGETVVTIPDVLDGADEMVMKDTSQTLTNKTLTAPVMTSAAINSASTIVLPATASPAQTAAGSMVWDSDDLLLTVGKGSGVPKVMVDTDSQQTLSQKTLSGGTIASASITNPTMSGAAINSATRIYLGSLTTGVGNSHVLISDANGDLDSESALAKIRGGAGADMTNVTFPATGVIVTEAGSQTLSNKTIGSVTAQSGVLSIAGTGALKVPAGLGSERPGSPVEGMIRYNSETDSFEGYASNAWSGIGGGGTVDRINKVGHAFVVGDVLWLNGSVYEKAKADAANTAEVVGMVSRVIDVDNFEMTLSGEVAGLTGLVAGEVYFLSAATAGLLTVTEPSVVGQVSLPVGVASSTTSLYVAPKRGVVVGGANLRTQLGLNGAALVSQTTNIQNVTAYTAGELSGWVYIDATTDRRFYIQVQFVKDAANAWKVAYQTTGDTPPAGFNVDVIVSGPDAFVQVQMPPVAGWVSGSVNFALNAPAVGATLPLQVDSANVSFTNIQAASSAGIAFKEDGGTTTMTITDAGNVGIGTASPGAKLEVTGETRIYPSSGAATMRFGSGGVEKGKLSIDASSNMLFETAGTERMRIDASGKLSVGNNSASNTIGGLVNIENGGLNSQPGFTYYYNAAAPNATGFYVNSPQAGTATSNWYAFYSRVAGADKFYVTGAGVIHAVNTSVQPIASDREVKQDIVDYDKGLNAVLAMKPRYFAYKNDPENVLSGFIAQEIDEALPGAMVETKEGHKTYSVNWYPVLVKAIQEQQAQIEEMKAKLAALEAK